MALSRIGEGVGPEPGATADRRPLEGKGDPPAVFSKSKTLL
jgi:hypothetical protein